LKSWRISPMALALAQGATSFNVVPLGRAALATSVCSSMPDYQEPCKATCLEDDQPKLRMYLKHIVSAVATVQGAIALCRFAIGDFWGALTDALVCFFGFLCIFEFEILYVLFYCLSCLLDCGLSLSTALLIWLRSDFVRPKHTDLTCACSASAAALGVCASLALWDDMRRTCKEDFIQSAFASITYGSLKEDGGQPTDPFLLQEDGQPMK